MESNHSTARLPRTINFALCLTAGLWTIAARTTAARAADGIATRLALPAFEPLLAAAFLVFLILAGFAAIHWVATRQASVRAVNTLVLRSTTGFEWRLGALVGWGCAVAVVLPVVFGGDLHPTFWWTGRGLGLTLLSVATLLLGSLAIEAIFRGYILGRLVAVVGPTSAALALSALYAFGAALQPQATRTSVLAAFLLSLLLSMAYLRTHALWLPWGLHFAWAASFVVLFGLPVDGAASFTTVVDSTVRGAEWLGGGVAGPAGSSVCLVVLCVAMFALHALTRDLAWTYTLRTIVGAGEAMDVAPPAEHLKMEAASANAAPALVQILASTPQAVSTSAAVREHLSGDDGTS